MREDKEYRKTRGCLTRIMWMLLVIIAVLAVLILIQGSGRMEEEQEDKPPVIMTAVTPPTELREPWVRYDVPLDDDLQQYIGQVCREYGVPTEIVMAIIDMESDYQADRIGDGGRSYGLMQIYASQHTERCVELGAVNLLDPRQNILAGVDFLAELLDIGPMDWALSFYNGGGGELPWPYADAVMDRAEILDESAVLEVTP